MHLCMVVEHKRCRSSTHLRRRQGKRTRPGHHRRLAQTVELLAHLCSSDVAGLRPAVRLVWKQELKDRIAHERDGVSENGLRSATRKLTARGTAEPDLDDRAPSTSALTLRGIFLVHRDPVYMIPD